MTDYAQKERQAFIRQTPEWKLARAKQVLGERWVFHPVNRVQRLEPNRWTKRN